MMRQTDGQSLITINEFATLSNDEQIEYLTKQYNLKEPFLIGNVLGQQGNSRHLTIENLKNPYNGEIIKRQLFSDLKIQPNSAVFFGTKLSDFNLKPGQLVLFCFRSTNIYKNLEKGDVLVGLKASIQPLESTEEALQIKNISLEELLNIQLDTGFDKIGYVSDLYRTNVMAIVESRVENIIKLTDELNEKEAKLENEDTKLAKREKALLAEQIKFDKHVAKRNHLHNEDKKRQKKELEKEQQAVYAELNEVNEQVVKLGFPPLPSTKHMSVRREETEPLTPLPKTDKKIVHAIHEQINKRGLDYDYATIRQFYSALKANQFTILSGPSGTGKTSLISAFAEVTSSLAKIIPVQPSWTDKQDLLGYYNPLDKQYVPSQLLDALIDAETNKNKLYLICLDELNLAQIEYYFADILSLREQRGIALELYSEYEYDQNMDEIEWYVKEAVSEQGENPEGELTKLIEEKLKVATIDQFRYVQRYNNLQRYNWSIHIPRNVRFIGTMNIDGTVRPLSPKVVDRSFIIPLERQKYDGEIAEDELIFDLTYENFSQVRERDPDNEIKANLQNTLANNLQTLEADFNTRVDNHLDDYIAIAKELAVEDTTILDELILLKLLPRINKLIDRDEGRLEDFKQKIKSLTGPDGNSLKTVAKMMEKAEQTKIFSYWS